MPRNSSNSDTVKGLAVEVRNNDINRALRKLKKMINEDGIIKTLRDKQQYTKPSDRKRLAKNAARRRWKKQEQKLKDQGLL